MCSALLELRDSQFVCSTDLYQLHIVSVDDFYQSSIMWFLCSSSMCLTVSCWNGSLYIPASSELCVRNFTIVLFCLLQLLRLLMDDQLPWQQTFGLWECLFMLCKLLDLCEVVH